MKKIIEFKNITKKFLNGKIIANNDVSFDIKSGQIHAIIGENGAGKTTLISMLFGLIHPDEGEIKVKGKSVKFKSASDAVNSGLGMVYQHFQLVHNFSVVDNVMLGSEEGKFGIIQKKHAIKKIEDISKKYNLHINPNEKISKLTVGQQQRVEIIKLLYRNADILILDEPTAMLSPSEINDFLKILKDLKSQGKTIIFISHKLEEIKEVADSATILRRGKHISTFDVQEKTILEMSQDMVGRELEIISEPSHATSKSKTLLKVENLTTKKFQGKQLKDVNLQVKEGEILVIAGVEGNGQSLLANTISGVGNTKIKKGHIYIDGHNVTKSPISKKYKTGLAHIPEDRHKLGMFLPLKIYETICMRRFWQKPYSKFGLISHKEMKKYAKEIIEQYDVRGANEGMAIGSGLSGGNQQKAVVGREIKSDHKVLLVFQATRGLDVGAIEYIHKQLNNEKKKNKAILLITYDLNEAMSLADRLIVMDKGQIAGELSKNEISKEKIGQMIGVGK